MIKLECNRESVKSTLCGTPIELMAESCVIMNSIAKRILRDCPKATLQQVSGIFIEEIVTAITDGIDEIKEGSDE